jgi:hypothetical protein
VGAITTAIEQAQMRVRTAGVIAMSFPFEDLAEILVSLEDERRGPRSTRANHSLQSPAGRACD